MLDLENNNMLVSHLDAVKDPGVKDAFRYLIGWSTLKPDFICRSAEGPVIKDVRFHCGGSYYFAFIPNQEWLLFYFRKPCQHEEKYSLKSILEIFPNAQKNNKGEVTVKIFSLNDAVKLCRHIDS